MNSVELAKMDFITPFDKRGYSNYIVLAKKVKS